MFVDPLLQDTKRHRLLDNVIIIRHETLVDTALEQFRGIVATIVIQLAFLALLVFLRIAKIKVNPTYSASRNS